MILTQVYCLPLLCPTALRYLYRKFVCNLTTAALVRFTIESHLDFCNSFLPISWNPLWLSPMFSSQSSHSGCFWGTNLIMSLSFWSFSLASHSLRIETKLVNSTLEVLWDLALPTLPRLCTSPLSPCSLCSKNFVLFQQFMDSVIFSASKSSVPSSWDITNFVTQRYLGSPSLTPWPKIQEYPVGPLFKCSSDL